MAKYPIGFWNYPNVETTPVSDVARWANCGITCNQTPTFSYRHHDPARMTAFLDEMHAHGMQAFVYINDLIFHNFKEDPEAFRAELQTLFDEQTASGVLIGYDFIAKAEPSAFSQFLSSTENE